MTDLDTMIRTCLDERAQLAPTVDPGGGGAHDRSRSIVRRQQVVAIAATAVVVAGGVVAGIALSARHSAGRGHSTILSQASQHPPTKAPSCPSGTVPNLSVKTSAAVQPVRTLTPAGSSKQSLSFAVGDGVVFLVNGKVPPTHTLWILVRNAGSDQTRFVVSKPGSMSPDPQASADPRTTDYTEDVNGWLATFAGCQAP